MDTMGIRRLIHAIYELMVFNNKDYFPLDTDDKNCPCITNQNNGFKYKVDTIYIPNVKGGRYFIELDVYNPYDFQYYNVILYENDWDINVLVSIYDIMRLYLNTGENDFDI